MMVAQQSVKLQLFSNAPTVFLAASRQFITLYLVTIVAVQTFGTLLGTDIYRELLPEWLSESQSLVVKILPAGGLLLVGRWELFVVCITIISGESVYHNSSDQSLEFKGRLWMFSVSTLLLVTTVVAKVMIVWDTLNASKYSEMKQRKEKEQRQLQEWIRRVRQGYVY